MKVASLDVGATPLTSQGGPQALLVALSGSIDVLADFGVVVRAGTVALGCQSSGTDACSP